MGIGVAKKNEQTEESGNELFLMLGMIETRTMDQTMLDPIDDFEEHETVVIDATKDGEVNLQGCKS